MATTITGAIQTQQPTTPRLAKTGFSLREFYRLNPPIFSGETNSLIAEDWLEQITKVLEGMPMEDDTIKVHLATFS